MLEMQTCCWLAWLPEAVEIVEVTVVVEKLVTGAMVVVESEDTTRSFELPDRYPAPALTRIATNRIPTTDSPRI